MLSIRYEKFSELNFFPDTISSYTLPLSSDYIQLTCGIIEFDIEIAGMMMFLSTKSRKN